MCVLKLFLIIYNLQLIHKQIILNQKLVYLVLRCLERVRKKMIVIFLMRKIKKQINQMIMKLQRIHKNR